MDCVFVEKLAGIDAARNGGISSNLFNLLSSQPISMTDSPPTSSRRRTLLSLLPPPLSSPSPVIKIVVIVIVVIVAVARCLHPIRLHTAPRVTPPPLQVLDNAPQDEVQRDVGGCRQLIVYVTFGFAFCPNCVDGRCLTRR